MASLMIPLTLLVLACFFGYRAATEPFDLVEHRRLVVFLSIGLGVAVLGMSAAVGGLGLAPIVAAGKAGVRHSEWLTLPAGERLEALCSAAFVPSDGTQITDYLAVTDQRLLRVRRPQGRNPLAIGEISSREGLACVALTIGRGGAHPLLGPILRLSSAERGLTLELKDGRAVFVALDNLLYLEPVFSWFESAGFETDQRDDRDLPPRDYAEIVLAGPIG